jgi:tetratricopeptide (TPR) repeat protein
VALTQPLLGYRVLRLEPAARRMKAFRIGPFQVYAQPGRIFTKSDTLAVVFQLNNLSPELAAAAEVRVAFLKDGQPFRETRRKPAEYPDLPVALEETALADFPPAHYEVRVSVSSGGTEVVAASEEFDLTFAEAVPRPWFSSRVLPDAGDPGYGEIVGSQLFNLGRFAEARVYLERALAKNPASEETAGALARTCLALDDAPSAVRVLAPFADPARTAKYETSVLAAEALLKVGQPGRAAELVDKAVAHYGINASLMNLLGDCYLAQGKTGEALAAFAKSLELSPEQPAVRDKVEGLKKRR